MLLLRHMPRPNGHATLIGCATHPKLPSARSASGAGMSAKTWVLAVAAAAMLSACSRTEPAYIDSQGNFHPSRDIVFNPLTDEELGPRPDRSEGGRDGGGAGAGGGGQGGSSGGSSGSSSSSDARLKQDVVLLKKLDNGLNLYRFRYIGQDQLYVGVMAQEVRKVDPVAVMRGRDGYLRVDYGKLGLKLMTWEEWQATARLATAR
jgi:hypothetical protein